MPEESASNSSAANESAPSGSLFVGRLAFDCRTRELEDLFGRYGRLTRCDLKKGYAFVEYEDERDAADAIKYLDGTRFLGMNISVERTRSERKPPVNPDGSRNRDCFKCGKPGHYARECRRNYNDRQYSRSRSRGRSKSRSISRGRSRSKSISRDCFRSRSRSNNCHHSRDGLRDYKRYSSPSDSRR